MKATIKFDGGARPNPGPSSIGYIVSTDDSTERGSHQIGEATNNQAEYYARASDSSTDGMYRRCGAR